MSEKVGARVRVKAYDVVQRAVEEGARYAANRAFKHTDRPTPENIADVCEREVMNALCEVLEFGDDEG